MSEEPASSTVSSIILLVIALQLVPAIAVITCVVYSKVALDPGPLWILGTLFSIPTALGLVSSVITVVLAAAFKKISRGYLIAACLIISAAGTGWWCSLYGIQNPFSR